MAATYPGGLKTYTDETNKQDLADAAVINSLQQEVQAIQAELGIDPAGTLSTLLARLALIQATNGALANGSSFPGSPVDGQVFYRTDENVLHIFNGSSWDSQGQSLSNVIFSDSWSITTHTDFFHNDEATTNGDENSGSQNFRYWTRNLSTSFSQIYPLIRWKKIAGISTITFVGKLWNGANKNNTFQLDVGGQTADSSTYNTTTPTEKSVAVDVSSLSDGTIYDITFKAKTVSTTEINRLGEFILFGS